jgi:hypothetical protein
MACALHSTRARERKQQQNLPKCASICITTRSRARKKHVLARHESNMPHCLGRVQPAARSQDPTSGCLSVSCRGTTPLHFAAAAKNNALAVCQLLLQHGANPNQAGERQQQLVRCCNSSELRHCKPCGMLLHLHCVDGSSMSATLQQQGHSVPYRHVNSFPTHAAAAVPAAAATCCMHQTCLATCRMSRRTAQRCACCWEGLTSGSLTTQVSLQVLYDSSLCFSQSLHTLAAVLAWFVTNFNLCIHGRCPR